MKAFCSIELLDSIYIKEFIINQQNVSIEVFSRWPFKPLDEYGYIWSVRVRVVILREFENHPVVKLHKLIIVRTFEITDYICYLVDGVSFDLIEIRCIERKGNFNARSGLI
ncbi:MAG: hypothetical protein JW863_05890 [Chitinispirillaceae bacterium]|nr:hypothetical protein [Chitinispirillaceae bacterium]